MAAADQTDESPRRRIYGAVAAVGILLLLIGLCGLRRKPHLVDALYDLGNVLETHKASGITLYGFCAAVARVELVLFAILVVVATGAAPASRRALVAFVGSMAVFVVTYADSATRYTATLSGRLYYWLCDDALISMRYARNFAEGRGLVYNVGERVDGFTNPLWTAIMVIPHALGLHEGITPVPIVALGGGLLVAMAGFARKVLNDAEVSIGIQVLAALMMVFDVSLFDFSIIGLETPLVAMGVALVMAGGLASRERWIWIGIILVTLARADGAVVAGLLVGWLAVEESATTGDSLVTVARRHWKRGALLVGVAGTLVAWRLALYGYPAPNTYYLKVYSLGDRIPAGIASYGVRGLLWYGLPVAFVLWGASRYEEARRARRMLLPVAGVWIYAMYVGGDAFALLRFLAPVAAPFLWTAVGLTAAAVSSRTDSPLASVLVVLLTLATPIESERGVLGSAWDRSNAVREWVTTAKTLEQNTPPDASIATFFAGVPYYAPHRRFVDVLGKTELHIAHQKTIHGVSPGHNKYDFAYVYAERKPDVTFTAWSCDEVDRWLRFTPEEFAKEANYRPESYQAPADQLRDPAFRELYYPKRVVLRDGDGPAGHMLGCWFIRTDSNVPVVWQLAHP